MVANQEGHLDPEDRHQAARAPAVQKVYLVLSFQVDWNDLDFPVFSSFDFSVGLLSVFCSDMP